MRNVAIEFVRISALFMLILSALSLFNVDWHNSLFKSLSSILLDGNFSPELGGDNDDDGDNVDETKRRPPDDETRKFCGGDIDRFCGDANGANCPFGDDSAFDAGGNDCC